MRCERELLKALIFKTPDFSYGPWETASPECIDFLKRLLTKEYKKRMTVQQAIDHVWIRKHLRWWRSIAMDDMNETLEAQGWGAAQFT